MNRLTFIVSSALVLLAACNAPRVAIVPGQLVVDPAELDFGNVELGKKVTRELVLENPGRVAVAVSQVGIIDDDLGSFSLVGDLPVIVEGGSSATLTVSFGSEAGALGPRVAVLSIEAESQNGSALFVPLRGTLIPADSGIDAGVDGGTGTDAGTAVWLAFDSNRGDGTRDIYAVREDGSELRQLTTESSSESQPAFSPDGRQLAFISDRDDFTMQIFVMDLATKAVRQVTHGSKNATEPAWSPDSKRLAFARGIGVYTIALDGSDEVHIIDGMDVLNRYQRPSYLPNGNWLVMDRGNQIDMIRTDGSALRQIIQNTLTTIIAPTVSPSGSSIAFAAYCEGGLSVRSAPTAALTEACSEDSQVKFPGRRPAWGPHAIAFETDEAKADIHVISAQGDAESTLVLHPADDRNPAWSPAGVLLP